MGEDEQIQEESNQQIPQEQNVNNNINNKVDNRNLVSNTQQNNSGETNSDLPYTGTKSTVMIIVLLIISAVVLYINYRKYDEVQ